VCVSSSFAVGVLSVCDTLCVCVFVCILQVESYNS
jgi:hypothetical protein